MLEDIKKIKIAEEEAETIVGDAKVKATSIVNEAKNKAKKLYNEAMESNKKEFDKIVEGYKKEGADESAVIMAESEKNVKNIKDVPSEKVSNAIDFILKESIYGN